MIAVCGNPSCSFHSKRSSSLPQDSSAPKTEMEEQEQEQQPEQQQQLEQQQNQEQEQPVLKRKPGRPPKYPKALQQSLPAGSSAKRKRGRPPKSASSFSPDVQAQVLLDSGSPADAETFVTNDVAADALVRTPPTEVKIKRGPGRPPKSPGSGPGRPHKTPGLGPGRPPKRVIGPNRSPKRRGPGRPPKQAVDGISGSPHLKEMKVKLEHARERSIQRHGGMRFYQGTSLSPLVAATSSPAAVLPVQMEMMEEVVRHSPFMDAVVKVFCVHTEPNFSLPWQMKRQFSSNSSGFIISDRRVLTNAHSVEHHTQVKVKRRGSDTKFLATVLAIGTECDIALLTVDNDEFWKGVSPVEFGTLPSLQDAVTVVGYPIGGDTISVTSGVVSRIEVTAYVHGATELLGVQIDAAINAGNSGGPAFNDRGRCVGIAFQSLKNEDAENIGYVIPTPVITHFINDYERNKEYTGFPILGIDWQKIENPDLRKSLGMEVHQKGVRVKRVEPTAPAAKFLQSSDILLSFDGIDVANDGTVPFRHGERIGFSYLVSQKYTGEQAMIKILREAKSLEFDVKLETHKRLVPAHIKGRLPSYYIVAGIVFAAVSVLYLRSEYGKEYEYDAPVKLLDKLLYSMAQTEDEQLVVISQVLVADINIGYEDIVNTQIIAFNGIPVRNLKHLVHMVESCKDEFLRFDLEYQQMVVLETKKAKEVSPEILATHCIPSAMSDDLKS